MRFLLFASKVSKKVPSKVGAAGAASIVAGDSPTRHTLVTEKSDGAVVVAKRWGQQCGTPWCGCVVRWDVGLDGDDRAVTAAYTAKRVLLTTSSGRTKHPIPIRTTKGRLQLAECTCPTLHQLCSATLDFLLPPQLKQKSQRRLLWQLQNYHDFVKPRSSEAFRRAVLQAHGLWQNNSTNSHCFDVVEDSLTALFKGYIPAPRQNDKVQSEDDFYDDPAVIEEEDDMPLLPETHPPPSSTPAEWHERITLATAPWSWSWFGNDNQKAQKWETHKTVAESSHNTNTSSRLVDPSVPFYNHQQHLHNLNHSHHWTALHWLDTVECERQLLEQKQQQQLRATDWLSYVDLLHQNTSEQHHQHQSA